MKRILLVDDEISFARPMQKILSNAGYAVETANDGLMALEMYRRQPADLVIMDLIMPEKEGLETIPELLQLNPGLKIIAMSGGGRLTPDSYLHMATCLGAAVTLAKPFGKDELLRAVERLLAEP